MPRCPQAKSEPSKFKDRIVSWNASGHCQKKTQVGLSWSKVETSFESKAGQKKRKPVQLRSYVHILVP